MKRPFLFLSMAVCALFWTILCFLPLVNKPANYIKAVADHQQAPTAQTAEALKIAERNRNTTQTTVWGLTFVSWIGVAVMFMDKRPAEAATESA